MDHQDRQAIEGLFGKLSDVERQGAPRDAEAETYIRDRMSAQPQAAYYMAQTIIVQEQALEQANARITELERGGTQGQGNGGGFLGGLLGKERPAERKSPWAQAPGQQGYAAPSRGGGFLAGAAQTAVGVAGGVLLGNAVAGMFDSDEAHAAEHAGSNEEASEDEGGIFGGFGDEL